MPGTSEEIRELQRKVNQLESWVSCLLEILINKNVITERIADNIMALEGRYPS